MPGTPYLTKAELRAEPWNISTDEAPDAKLDALITQVKEVVDAACIQRFDDHARTINGVGNGTALFQPTFFDTRPFGRMRTLTSITVEGVAYAVSNFRLAPWQIIWLPPAPESRRRFFRLEPFFPKDRAVVAVVQCGYVTIPEDVKRLFGLVVLRALRPELQEGAKFNTESLPGRSYTMRRIGGREYFGDPELDRLVEDWRYQEDMNWAAV